MKKLLRLAFLSVLFLISFVFLFSLFPFLVWILGGEFLSVLHHPAYCFFGGIAWSLTIGINLHSEFDADFYIKNKTKKK